MVSNESASKLDIKSNPETMFNTLITKEKHYSHIFTYIFAFCSGNNLKHLFVKCAFIKFIIFELSRNNTQVCNTTLDFKLPFANTGNVGCCTITIKLHFTYFSP